MGNELIKWGVTVGSEIKAKSGTDKMRTYKFTINDGRYDGYGQRYGYNTCGAADNDPKKWKYMIGFDKAPRRCIGCKARISEEDKDKPRCPNFGCGYKDDWCRYFIVVPAEKLKNPVADAERLDKQKMEAQRKQDARDLAWLNMFGENGLYSSKLAVPSGDSISSRERFRRIERLKQMQAAQLQEDDERKENTEDDTVAAAQLSLPELRQKMAKMSAARAARRLEKDTLSTMDEVRKTNAKMDRHGDSISSTMDEVRKSIAETDRMLRELSVNCSAPHPRLAPMLLPAPPTL